MTTAKRARKAPKRKRTQAETKKPARRRTPAAQLAGAVRRWGLRLDPKAVEFVERAADARRMSGSAVIAAVVLEAAAAGQQRQEESLEEFSARVVAAARRSVGQSSPGRQGERCGENKVFLRAAYNRLAADMGAPSYARLLSLARADLVEAMHPQDVAESAVSSFSSTFNFIALSA